MAERVERITNLLALLLATREPLTLQSIADELHGSTQMVMTRVAQRSSATKPCCDRSG